VQIHALNVVENGITVKNALMDTNYGRTLVLINALSLIKRLKYGKLMVNV